MRSAVSSLATILFCFLFITGGTKAQVPTPTPLIEGIVPKCGFPESVIRGASACCEPVDIGIVKTPVRIAASLLPKLPIPFVGSAPEKFVDILFDEIYELEPFHKELDKQCRDGAHATTDITTKACICVLDGPTPTPTVMATYSTDKLKELCNKYSKGEEKNDCEDCAIGGGILTSVGCVPTDYSTFISEFLLRVGVGFGGIIALGCIIYSALTIQTSQGNPETIQKAREQIKSCLFGLLLILFSVLILQIIGVNILGLPGFT